MWLHRQHPRRMTDKVSIITTKVEWFCQAISDKLNEMEKWWSANPAMQWITSRSFSISLSPSLSVAVCIFFSLSQVLSLSWQLSSRKSRRYTGIDICYVHCFKETFTTPVHSRGTEIDFLANYFVLIFSSLSLFFFIKYKHLSHPLIFPNLRAFFHIWQASTMFKTMWLNSN